MDRKRILLVTGMSGAGTSTTLKALEDLGWELVDNLPLFLLDSLLEAPPPAGMEGKNRPLAISLGVRTRDFDPEQIIERVLQAEGTLDDPEQIIERVRRLKDSPRLAIESLFLNCGGEELKRRYAETRHRHPLALDRAADDGIAHERAILAPLRDMADRLLDTTNMTSNDLGQWIRANYAVEGLSEPVLTVMSFGFSRGLPRNADLVFDMRFLRNPHWSAELRPGTGLDQGVIDYIRRDPAYDTVLGQLEALLDTVVPRYIASGKSYITIAIGCTGGRHRSVHVAERIARRLRQGGFSPTVVHRDLSAAPKDSLEAGPAKQ